MIMHCTLCMLMRSAAKLSAGHTFTPNNTHQPSMCWLCVSAIYVLKALFFFLWDGLKALASPFRRRRPQKDYGEEICLVTGAAQGLGRLLALKLAERHAVLVIWDIQKEKLREVADEIKEIGSKVYPYVCDCSSRNDIYKTAEKVKKEVGPVSVLINNAGVIRSAQTIMESDDTDIKQTFKVNTFAHLWVRKYYHFPKSTILHRKMFPWWCSLLQSSIISKARSL